MHTNMRVSTDMSNTDTAKLHSASYAAAEKRRKKKKSRHVNTGYLMTVLKSTWYTVLLIIFLLAGSVVFMGIEGNHERYQQLNKLVEKEEFTVRLTQWIEGDKPQARALRQQIGLNETLPEEQYVTLLAEQLNKNMTLIRKYNERKCALAKWELEDWNTKTWGDSFMYSVSIMSTVGWGVYSPPTYLLKLITLIYLMFGIPIFATMINVISGILEQIEDSLRRAGCTMRICGSARFGLFVIGFTTVVTAVLGYAGICTALVEKGHQADEELNRALEDAVLNFQWDFFLSVYYTLETVTSIGFGDVYIFSPSHALLNFKPIMCLQLTAFLIALFARIFSKLQLSLERAASKRTNNVKRRMMTLGVIPIETSSVDQPPFGVSDTEDDSD